VAAARATTPIPIAIPVRIEPNSPELFFSNLKEYLDKNPSLI